MKYGMHANMNAVEIAVRVLQAIADYDSPDPLDTEFLRLFMPDLAAAPVDELACEIVHRELGRSKARGAA